MVFNFFFLILFNPFRIGKIEKPNFSDAINSSDINNWTTTWVKSINLHSNKKAIEYSLKNVPVKTISPLTFFEILLLKIGLVLSLT